MAKHSIGHLVKMLNQIAQSVPAATPEAKAKAAAAHIDRFWTPSMKQDVRDQVAGAEESLTPLAMEALKHLDGSQ